MANEEATKVEVAGNAEAEQPKPTSAPETPKEDPEVVKLKNALSRANSEAASWKKKYNDTLTEQQQAALKAEEERKAEREELIALRTDKRIGDYMKGLIEAGVDGNTASSMAKLLPEGVTDEYFATLKTYLANQRQAIDTAKLNRQPGLSVGVPPVGKSAEDLELDKIFHLI